MAKKNHNTNKKVYTQKTTEEKVVEKPVEEKFKHKVKVDCGFKKRNYYINNRNVLLVAGKEIKEDDYNCFSKVAKEKYFEEI